MVEALSVDATKIDLAMNEIGKLLIHLNKISKNQERKKI
jgi:hypothetical protein